MKEFIPDRLCTAAVTTVYVKKLRLGDCSQLHGGDPVLPSLFQGIKWRQKNDFPAYLPSSRGTGNLTSWDEGV